MPTYLKIIAMIMVLYSLQGKSFGTDVPNVRCEDHLTDRANTIQTESSQGDSREIYVLPLKSVAPDNFYRKIIRSFLRFHDEYRKPSVYVKRGLDRTEWGSLGLRSEIRLAIKPLQGISHPVSVNPWVTLLPFLSRPSETEGNLYSNLPSKFLFKVISRDHLKFLMSEVRYIQEEVSRELDREILSLSVVLRMTSNSHGVAVRKDRMDFITDKDGLHTHPSRYPSGFVAVSYGGPGIRYENGHGDLITAESGDMVYLDKDVRHGSPRREELTLLLIVGMVFVEE